MSEIATAAELVTEIGSTIVDLNPDAQGMAVVVILEGGTVQVSGYTYLDGLPPKAGIPTPFALFGKFKALQAAMERDKGGRRWVSALLQVQRSSGKAHITFEYDDPMRWKVSPANLATLPEEMRPAG